MLKLTCLKFAIKLLEMEIL